MAWSSASPSLRIFRAFRSGRGPARTTVRLRPALPRLSRRAALPAPGATALPEALLSVSTLRSALQLRRATLVAVGLAVGRIERPAIGPHLRYGPPPARRSERGLLRSM